MLNDGLYMHLQLEAVNFLKRLNNMQAKQKNL